MSSQLASQFDPLGMASPYLLWGKLILQKVATSGVDWDETLSVDIQDSWKKWLGTLSLINDFSIPRIVYLILNLILLWLSFNCMVFVTLLTRPFLV